MTTFEFQSMLHRNAAECAAAIASAFMTADGMNNYDDVTELLANDTDDALADEAISGWGLDQMVPAGFNADGNEIEAAWLETRELDRAAIVEAFADFRKNRPDAE